MTYNVWTLTLDQLRDLIASGDDSHDNQIRIKIDGEIFLSSDVGADNLTGIQARFDTFDAYNDYVGPRAAADSKFIQRLFNAIQAWKKSPRPYIDDWNVG